MANIEEKILSNVSVKECSNPSAHMDIKSITVEELKKELVCRGCYVTKQLGDLTNFIRKRYPGLTSKEMACLIKSNVFCCKF